MTREQKLEQALSDEHISELWLTAYNQHRKGSGTGNTRVKRFARLIETAILAAPHHSEAAKPTAGSEPLQSQVIPGWIKCPDCNGSAEHVYNDRNGDPQWDYAVPCQTCAAAQEQRHD